MNCDISEAFIKVIEIAFETSQISATSHTSSSSYDSNKVNNTFISDVINYLLFNSTFCLMQSSLK